MSFDAVPPGLAYLNDVSIPKSLVRDPAAFGGTDTGDTLHGRLHFTGGRAVRLDAVPPSHAGCTVLPALVEAHCHLDKCHTIDRMGSVGGDLSVAIAAQAEDKANWTEKDLVARATQGLSEAHSAGCRTLRTHVDWSDTPDAPLAWHVMAEVAQTASEVTFQRAALTGIDQMADRAFCDSVAKTVSEGCGVLGSFVLHHQSIADGLRNMFRAAERHGLALDFHVDEGHGDFNGLEAIADTAIATGFEGPILCGHAVSLMDRTPDAFARITGKLQRAGIAICALPTTNLYLQGRTKGTPDRRGITRLLELRAADVPIVIGSDNVADAFCPMGAHDPMAALHLACLSAHLDPPLGRWLPSITTDARRALGLDAVFIDGAHIQDLLIADTQNLADIVAGRSPLKPLSALTKEHQG